MTRLTGSAPRLTGYAGEHDTWHHRPLSSPIHTEGLVTLDPCEVVGYEGRRPS
ncbi:hypothetical protein [Streptomyces sp. NPDC059906]|uniref:hypothetical protein n=1 Tax=Streptomyces sp. NPDC059906 TaxID=3346997 RepID=UPI003667898E